jgi:hypothetical protein
MLTDQAAYHKGFFDAIDGEPLFEDADAVYAAGWRAYWDVSGKLTDADFLLMPDVAKLPTDPLRYRFRN